MDAAPTTRATAVICPFCNDNDDRVIDSRAAEGGRVIRRRRECLRCEKRFTTYERVEQTSRLMVVKRDGSRVPFDIENVIRGVAAACGKRPVPEHTRRGLAEGVEEELHREFDREVPAQIIGARVMRRLRDLDEVAFVRYASEHHQFRNLDELIEQVEELNTRVRDVKDQQELFDEG